MNAFTINNKRFEVPSEWNELTEDQMLRVAKLSLERCDAEEVKMLMLIHCLSARVRRSSNSVQLKIGDERYYLSAEQYAQLSSAFNWMFDDNGMPDCRRTKMPFPAIAEMKLPGDSLSSLSFEQYAIVSALCSMDPREVDLPKIISHLVLRKGEKYGGDDSEERQEEREERLKRMKPEQLTCVMMYLLGTIRQIRDTFGHLYPEDSEGSSAQARDLFRENMDLVESLSNGDVTKRDKVRESLMWDVLHSLDEKIKQHEKRMEELNNSKA